MKRLLFVAVALALATPAFSQTTTVTEYYVVQDTGTKNHRGEEADGDHHTSGRAAGIQDPRRSRKRHEDHQGMHHQLVPR